MRTTGGIGRGRRRGLTVLGCMLLALATAGCAQHEPDEQQVAEAVGKLPGVVAADASFTGASLGGAGDQDLHVQVASPPDAQQVEDLIRQLPKALQDIENGNGYDEFFIVTRTLGGEANASVGSSSLAFGPELTPPGLATRWAEAVATSPPGGLLVQVRRPPGTVTASVSSHDAVSTSLDWALSSGLTELDWTVVEYQTAVSPYVRFGSDQPLAAPMVAQWKAIEATYAVADASASIARAVVVEDVKNVRKVRVAVAYPGVNGPLTVAAHGAAIWPIVDAINASLPMGHRLDLELNRAERGEQGGAGDGDLVDGGTGSADWEAAYRQRFPDAVPVSATPR